MKGLFVLLSLVLVLNASSMKDKQKLQNQNIIDMAAKSLSQNLPQKVDKYTSLVDIRAQKGRLVYIFEINAPVSDEDIIKKDKTRMQRSITYGVCKSSKRFLDSDIKISYLYRGAKSKKELFRFDIDKSQCDFLPM